MIVTLLQSGTKGKQCVPLIVLPFDDMKRGPLLNTCQKVKTCQKHCNSNCKYKRTNLRQSKTSNVFLSRILVSDRKIQARFKQAVNKHNKRSMKTYMYLMYHTTNSQRPIQKNHNVYRLNHRGKFPRFGREKALQSTNNVNRLLSCTLSTYMASHLHTTSLIPGGVRKA